MVTLLHGNCRAPQTTRRGVILGEAYVDMPVWSMPLVKGEMLASFGVLHPHVDAGADVGQHASRGSRGISIPMGAGVWGGGSIL